MPESNELHLWLWIHTDELSGKRRQTRYKLTEADAHARLKDPVKVEWSHETRSGPAQSTSAWRGPSLSEK